MLIEILERLVGQNLDKMQEFIDEDRAFATSLQNEVSLARHTQEELEEFAWRITLYLETLRESESLSREWEQLKRMGMQDSKAETPVPWIADEGIKLNPSREQYAKLEEGASKL